MVHEWGWSNLSRFLRHMTDSRMPEQHQRGGSVTEDEVPLQCISLEEMNTT
jgi:hypothetical protein